MNSIRASSNCLPEPHISIVRDTIESVIFGNRHDEVIIATFSGSIKVSRCIKILLIIIQLILYAIAYFSLYIQIIIGTYKAKIIMFI